MVHQTGLGSGHFSEMGVSASGSVHSVSQCSGGASLLMAKGEGGGSQRCIAPSMGLRSNVHLSPSAPNCLVAWEVDRRVRQSDLNDPSLAGQDVVGRDHSPINPPSGASALSGSDTAAN